jgi:cytochrome c biogenesis protein CcmG/thiol:disulfide interchange protein DsbE
MDGLAEIPAGTQPGVQALGRAQTGRGRGPAGTLVIVAVTAAILLAVAYLSDRQDPAAGAGAVTAVTVSGTASGAAPTIGQKAPDFAALTADGATVKLSDFVGKPVWLTFGASWCQPCRAENPDIEATYQTISPDVIVLQVYMSEEAATVRDYRDRVGLTYLTVPDPSERLASEYRILGIPSHFFVDATGVLREMKIGSLDPASMQAAVARIRQGRTGSVRRDGAGGDRPGAA